MKGIITTQKWSLLCFTEDDYKPSEEDDSDDSCSNGVEEQDAEVMSEDDQNDKVGNYSC